ncbi:MAG: hypothetical protein AAF493_07405 [Pseudomonadota bacterium]
MEALLSQYVELQDPITYRQLQALTEWTHCPPEKAALEALSTTREQYEREVLDKRISLLALLERFPACELPFHRFLEFLPAAHPRYYSISSSPLVSPSRVDITVSVLDAKAMAGEGRFQGTCSNYLAGACASDTLWGRIRAVESRFVPPDDVSTPVVMIGPGTGLAPFRGFVQERLAHKEQGVSLGEALLFFGCRHPDADFLYREELAEAGAAGVVELLTAFSQMDDYPYRYVQDRLRDTADRVWSVIERGGLIYICGDANRMLPDVRRALEAIYQQCSPTPGSGEQWLTDLEINGQLLIDAWA